MQLNSGPPPKDPEKRARRNKPPTAAIQLPSEGRTGPAPNWPVGYGPRDDMEQEVWEELWKLPQAVAWEQMRVHYEVAEYVKAQRSSAMNAQTERRQMADRLGLNPLAMRRLGWEVVKPDIDAATEPARPVATQRYGSLRVARRSS